MSKNNKQVQYTALSYEEEYGIIKKDLIRVLLLNSIYLILILAVYFTNRKYDYLVHIFSKLVK